MQQISEEFEEMIESSEETSSQPKKEIQKLNRQHLYYEEVCHLYVYERKTRKEIGGIIGKAPEILSRWANDPVYQEIYHKVFLRRLGEIRNRVPPVLENALIFLNQVIVNKDEEYNTDERLRAVGRATDLCQKNIHQLIEIRKYEKSEKELEEMRNLLEYYEKKLGLVQ